MRRDLKSLASSTTQHGFSMLEILITLALIAIALLGTAGMQVLAMKSNKGAHFRTQAVFLSSDIAERMEANKLAAMAGAYVVTGTSAVAAAAADCSQAACSSTNLASYDINQWETAIAGLLPQASWSVTQTGTGDPSTYNIVISWTDRSSDKTSHGETFSYTATRTID